MRTPSHIRRALYGPLCLMAALNIVLAVLFVLLGSRAGGGALALTGGYLALALYLGWRVLRVRPVGWPHGVPDSVPNSGIR